MTVTFACFKVDNLVQLIFISRSSNGSISVTFCRQLISKHTCLNTAIESKAEEIKNGLIFINKDIPKCNYGSKNNSFPTTTPQGPASVVKRHISINPKAKLRHSQPNWKKARVLEIFLCGVCSSSACTGFFQLLQNQNLKGVYFHVGGTGWTLPGL